MHTAHLTPNAPAPVGPYSQAVEVGGFLFCSGQIAIDSKTNQLRLGPVQEQTRLILENIDAVLKSAGMGFKHVVKTTIYLTDMKDFAAVNEVYGEVFGEQFPARSTVEVSGLPKGAHVEIEVVAHR